MTLPPASTRRAERVWPAWETVELGASVRRSILSIVSSSGRRSDGSGPFHRQDAGNEGAVDRTVRMICRLRSCHAPRNIFYSSRSSAIRRALLAPKTWTRLFVRYPSRFPFPVFYHLAGSGRQIIRGSPRSLSRGCSSSRCYPSPLVERDEQKVSLTLFACRRAISFVMVRSILRTISRQPLIFPPRRCAIFESLGKGCSCRPCAG